MTDADKEYAAIVDRIDWSNPEEHLERLRRLVALGHAESMNLLAILLGDIDSYTHRDQIISLYEKAYEFGSSAAAKGMSIQYAQWGEPFLSKVWERRSRERGVE